jgi:hypothetical protein
VIITVSSVHSKYSSKLHFHITLYQLLVLQELVETSNKKLLCFIKLHATWPILCHYAEEMNMRAPLQVGPSCSMQHSPALGANAKNSLIFIDLIDSSPCSQKPATGPCL